MDHEDDGFLWANHEDIYSFIFYGFFFSQFIKLQHLDISNFKSAVQSSEPKANGLIIV